LSGLNRLVGSPMQMSRFSVVMAPPSRKAVAFLRLNVIFVMRERS
jgi:hypothetical protein